MADERKKCKHEGCSCMAAEGQDYCSPSCHDARDVTDIMCNCGHPDCAGNAARL